MLGASANDGEQWSGRLGWERLLAMLARIAFGVGDDAVMYFCAWNYRPVISDAQCLNVWPLWAESSAFGCLKVGGSKIDRLEIENQ